MPAVTSGLVLVTGASGFLGTNAVAALQAAGYRVRATVRSAAKGEFVKSQYPGVEYAVVPDMSVSGAYDQALKDVDAVVNVASPLELDHAADAQQVIGPAVAGIESLLASAADPKNGAKVKRFVHTSSTAATAMTRQDRPGQTVDELVWNEEEVALLKEEGVSSDPMRAYVVSKVKAEQAFWRFFETPRAFEAVALRPCMILGPPTQFDAANANAGNSTVAWTLPYSLPGRTEEELQKEYPMIIDVRDCALAFVRALQVSEAAGQKFHLAAGPLFGNDLALAAAKVFTDRGLNPGHPEAEYRAKLDKRAFIWDGSKATRVLGIKYTPRDKTLADMYAALKQ